MVRLLLSLSLLSLALSARAEPSGGPAPFPEATATTLGTNSPFTRRVKAADSLVLRGFAQIGSERIAIIEDRETGDRHQVSGNILEIDGLRLQLVQVGEDGQSARLLVDGEETEIQFVATAVKTAAPVKISKEALYKKYGELSRDQRTHYLRWRENYKRAHPKLMDSDDRFPVVNKALDAVRKGDLRALPKP